MVTHWLPKVIFVNLCKDDVEWAAIEKLFSAHACIRNLVNLRCRDKITKKKITNHTPNEFF